MSYTRDAFPDYPTYFAYVRRRPGLYLGGKSIAALRDQLVGIAHAEDFHDIPESARISGFDRETFEAWVRRNFNPNEWSVLSFSLSEMIAGSDEAGFELWFRWYDEFHAERAANEAD